MNRSVIRYHMVRFRQNFIKNGELDCNDLADAVAKELGLSETPELLFEIAQDYFYNESVELSKTGMTFQELIRYGEKFIEDMEDITEVDDNYERFFSNSQLQEIYSLFKEFIEGCDYADSYRVAVTNNVESLAAYSIRYNNGCCGYSDRMFTMKDGTEVLIGFNYGH
jgi:hypothetical protein